MQTVYKNLVIDGKETDLVCEDGKIVSVGKTTAQGEECRGLVARAGLFDIHAHGCLGTDADTGGAARMAGALGARGVTSFLPTTTTQPREVLAEIARTFPAREKGAARIRGLHLEGPFVAESKKGAQNAAYIQTPDASLLDACPEATLLSIAPELPHALDVIGEAASRGVRVAIGHTEADYDMAVKAFRAGACCLTHTFNAMPPLSHRAPGPIGAALTEDGYVQLISDGIHVHPAAVLALYRMFGPDRVILISDMISATGLADGDYTLGGLPVTVKGRRALLSSDGVTLAGSATFLDDCVRCAVSFGIPVEDAFRMASATPAEMMGIPCGKLREGYDADFALYDEKLICHRTVIDGEWAT